MSQVLQMIYDKTCAGNHLGEVLIPTLAWWHTYKTSTYLVYAKYAKTVFAGLHHTLFPSNIFFLKPTYLTNCLLLFQYTRLAYPVFSESLKTALRRRDLSEASRAHLTNIQSLCEFFIPSVSTTQHNQHVHITLCTVYCSLLFYVHVLTSPTVYVTLRM